MDILQKKLTTNGMKEWEIDLDAVKMYIPWAKKKPELLEKELEDMQKPIFNLFILTISNENGNDVALCPNCNDLAVFWDRAVRCVNCESELVFRSNKYLGYFGIMPSPIGTMEGEQLKGRPFLKKIFTRIEDISDYRKKEIYQSYFFTLESENNSGAKKLYFAPPVLAFYPDGWNRDFPNIYLRPEYFKILDIPPDHIYPFSGPNYRLCIYASWHKVTMAITLQQRILPRIIIDLMLADLKAVGKLNDALDNLSTSMHGVYNFIGRRRSEDFKEQYEQYVHID